MRVIVQVLYTKDWVDLAKITIPNIFEYCIAHEYQPYILCINSPYDAFDKIRNCLSNFELGFDIVWCLDADAIVTNYKIGLESFVDDKHDFYLCEDVNGYNTGSFIVKKSEWSVNFLNEVLSQINKEGVYCEQDAIINCMNAQITDKIRVLPHPSINSYRYIEYGDGYGRINPNPNENTMPTHKDGNWEEGDFVLHLPGLSMQKRIEILSQLKPIK